MMTKAPILTLRIEGAGCASCVGKIEKALLAVPGVTDAHMNFAQRQVMVAGSAGAETLVAAVNNAGYGAELAEGDQEDALERRDAADRVAFRQKLTFSAMALALGIPMMAWGMFFGDMMVRTTAQQWGWGIAGLLTLAVMATAGRHFYVGAWKSVRLRNANMDTLIALGTGAAWLYSVVVVLFPAALPEAARHVYFEATVMIIGLVNLGLALELRARGKTSEAIRRLVTLKPKTVRLERPDGSQREVPLAFVGVGDLLRVRPGETLAVDGVIREGQTHIDESMLTGEPWPVSRGPGDSVSAGTLNQSGSILFEAQRVGNDTALARIISMVQEAQNARLPISRLADRIAAWFVPMVLVIAVASLVLWLIFGPPPAMALALVAATTVLIIACPCALGLATPMSVMVGVGKAAEAGILIRNGEALQKAAGLTVMVLDKTGTITRGEPTVTHIHCVAGVAENEVLRIAAAVEAGSEHPLARAIVAEAARRNIDVVPVTQFRSQAGKGIQAVLDDAPVIAGNAAWLAEQGIDCSVLLEDAATEARHARSMVYLAHAGKALALIGVADAVRDDSAVAIAALKEAGLRVIMLSGDQRATAEAVSVDVGITEVVADVLPENKSEVIRQLQEAGEIVGMAGDGINDAPALARADVGFAVGTGTDVAIASADITLMRDSLWGLVDAIHVSKATLGNIRQNLFGAFVYNSAGIPVAAGVLYPFTGMLLSPVIAGAAMAFSSVTVVANANRLRGLRLRSVQAK